MPNISNVEKILIDKERKRIESDLNVLIQKFNEMIKTTAGFERCVYPKGYHGMSTQIGKAVKDWIASDDVRLIIERRVVKRIANKMIKLLKEDG